MFSYTNPSFFHRCFGCTITCIVTVSVLLLVQVATAFPPAPAVVVYGIARNESGGVISGENAFIIFRSGDNVLARRSLRGDSESGENYRTLLPLDMDGRSGSYKSEVLDGALPFTVEIEIGNQTFYPIESLIGLAVPQGPGSVIRYDFSLGSDSDGDMIPDEWELWQLLQGGITPDSEAYSLDTLSLNGDFDNDGLTDREEYLAGTFAFGGFDLFQINILNRLPNGDLECAFLAVAGRTYFFESSSQLKTWNPLSVLVEDEPGGTGTSSFDARNTGVVGFTIPSALNNGSNFYRMRFE